MSKRELILILKPFKDIHGLLVQDLKKLSKKELRELIEIIFEEWICLESYKRSRGNKREQKGEAIACVLGGSIINKILNFPKKALLKVFREISNKFRIFPQSRPLLEGELHVPFHNFSGPGTATQYKYIREYPAYNKIDRCSKVHDLDYYDLKKVKDPLMRVALVREADKRAIKCYDKYPNEQGYHLARKGIYTKLKAEELLSNLLGKPSVFYGN